VVLEIFKIESLLKEIEREESQLEDHRATGLGVTEVDHESR
jgi:hypothetical protein